MADVLRDEHAPADAGTRESSLGRRHVAVEVPGRARQLANKLPHLQLWRHDALARKTALGNPAAELEVGPREHLPQVVKRTARQQRCSLIATLDEHPVRRLDVGVAGLQVAEAFIEATLNAFLVGIPRPLLRAEAHPLHANLPQEPPDQARLLAGARRQRHRAQLHPGVGAEKQQRQDVVRIAGLHVKDYGHPAPNTAATDRGSLLGGAPRRGLITSVAGRGLGLRNRCCGGTSRRLLRHGCRWKQTRQRQTEWLRTANVYGLEPT
mmetsp:Transcript_12994/g.41534  ORF Transcript_12994/g.41534 Transcript_12994/m.41534 type:complete len:266 (-) Transcript_12994:2-799(-)